MSDIKAAAEAARNLAKQYQSVLAVQAVLDRIGDIEAYTIEATRKRDEAKADLDKITASRDAAEVELGVLNSKLLEVQAEAERIVADAEASRAAAQEGGHSDAKQIRSEAEAEAIAVRSKLAQEIEAHEAAMADKRADLEAVEKKIAEAKAEFEAMRARLNLREGV